MILSRKLRLRIDQGATESRTSTFLAKALRSIRSLLIIVTIVLIEELENQSERICIFVMLL
jgi:hypothetical protein